MKRFYFPLLFLVTSSDGDVDRNPFRLHPRKWDVSIFDLYTLAASKNTNKLTAELMQLFLPKVGLEISILSPSLESACEKLDIIRAMLYVRLVTPTIAPFASSHSLNEYAGINSRSSISGGDKLPEELRQGITDRNSTVEFWPNELTFSIMGSPSGCLSNNVTVEIFDRAYGDALVWEKIENHDERAALLRSALVNAPLMPDRSSSILHMWQALEAIFGKGAELTFRMSLSIAQLCVPVASRVEIYKNAKKSYKDRSEIIHGKSRSITDEQWMRAWTLLTLVVQATIHRQSIPSEDEIFYEMLSS